MGVVMFSFNMNYNIVHKISKFIVCLINTGLLLIYQSNHITELLIIMNFTYFFGVNTIASFLEMIFNLPREHDNI